MAAWGREPGVTFSEEIPLHLEGTSKLLQARVVQRMEKVKFMCGTRASNKKIRRAVLATVPEPAGGLGGAVDKSPVVKDRKMNTL